MTLSDLAVTYADPNYQCGFGDKIKNIITAIAMAEILQCQYMHVPCEDLDFMMLQTVFPPLDLQKLQRRQFVFSKMVTQYAPPSFLNAYQIEKYQRNFRKLPYFTKTIGVDFYNLRQHLRRIISELDGDEGLIIITNRFRIQIVDLFQWIDTGKIHQDAVANIKNHLRRALSNNASFESPPAKKLRVFVHIRRGDVTYRNYEEIEPFIRKEACQHYCFPLAYYDKVINQLIARYGRGNLDITISTNCDQLGSDLVADIIQYADSNQFEITVDKQRIKDNFVHDFAAMVKSDILVVSNSSMSQVAGFLSSGIKIYHPNVQYYDLPTPEFIATNASGIILHELPDISMDRTAALLLGPPPSGQ